MLVAASNGGYGSRNGGGREGLPHPTSFQILTEKVDKGREAEGMR